MGDYSSSGMGTGILEISLKIVLERCEPDLIRLIHIKEIELTDIAPYVGD